MFHSWDDRKELAMRAGGVYQMHNWKGLLRPLIVCRHRDILLLALQLPLAFQVGRR
jgi:hypothetical protein